MYYRLRKAFVYGTHVSRFVYKTAMPHPSDSRGRWGVHELIQTRVESTQFAKVVVHTVWLASHIKDSIRDELQYQPKQTRHPTAAQNKQIRQQTGQQQM